MKRIVTIMFWLMCFGLVAHEQTATLRLDSICYPPPGGTIVSLTLEDINNPAGNNSINSFGFYIQYDSDVLGDAVNFVNVNPLFPFSNYVVNAVQDFPEPGWNTIAMVYSAGVSGATGYIGMTFFDLKYIYIGSPAASDLLLSVTGMYDDFGNQYNVTVINGYIGPCLVGIQKIKPDPFNIRFDRGNICFNAETGGEFSLFNLFGQQIMTATIHEGLNMMPVKNKNAFYLVRIESNNKTLTQKIFIQ